MIAICDDCERDTQILADHLKQAGHELGFIFNIFTYTTGTAFLNHFTPAFDLVFLDVQLPDINGSSIAAEIRKRDTGIYLVFISKFSETISIGYEYEAKNYLLKPLKYTGVLAEVKRFLKYESLLSKQYMLLTDKNSITKMYFSKLRYIETCGRHLLFHYDGQALFHTGKMSDYARMLPCHLFFRCCNSHLINMYYVSNLSVDINRYSIRLITGEEVPLSRDRKKDFLLHLQKVGERI